MHVAFLAILLEEEEMAAVMASERGSKAGKRNLPRVQKNLDAMMTELGNYVRRAYRVTLQVFLELHDTIALPRCVPSCGQVVAPLTRPVRTAVSSAPSFV